MSPRRIAVVVCVATAAILGFAGWIGWQADAEWGRYRAACHAKGGTPELRRDDRYRCLKSADTLAVEAP